jgi:hypothetical protein
MTSQPDNFLSLAYIIIALNKVDRPREHRLLFE